MTEYQALKKAIKLFGSQGKMGRALGVTQQCVNMWLLKDRRIGVSHALECHIKLAGEVSAHDRRPDMYPRGVVLIAESVEIK